MKSLLSDSGCDNVLLEWTLALDLVGKHALRGVIPIILDSISADSFPSVAMKSIHEKIETYLKRIPIREAAESCQRDTRSVLADILKRNGISMTNKCGTVKTLENEVIKLSKELLAKRMPSQHGDKQQRINELERELQELREGNRDYKSRLTEMDIY
jgi:hypothetical protein